VQINVAADVVEMRVVVDVAVDAVQPVDNQRIFVQWLHDVVYHGQSQ
jgi:hypothetical protein